MSMPSPVTFALPAAMRRVASPPTSATIMPVTPASCAARSSSPTFSGVVFARSKACKTFKSAASCTASSPLMPRRVPMPLTALTAPLVRAGAAAPNAPPASSPTPAPPSRLPSSAAPAPAMAPSPAPTPAAMPVGPVCASLRPAAVPAKRLPKAFAPSLAAKAAPARAAPTPPVRRPPPMVRPAAVMGFSLANRSMSCLMSPTVSS